MLNEIGVNGAVIEKENKPTKIIRKEFLFALGKAIVAESCKRRLYETNIPQTMKVRIQDIFSFPIKRARHDVPSKTSYSICSICPARKCRKTKKVCIECERKICGEHTIFYCSICNPHQANDIE